MAEKNSWPELVGKNVEEAKAILLAYNPNYVIYVLPEGSPVTQDFRPDRVRLFVDQETESIVKETAYVG